MQRPRCPRCGSQLYSEPACLACVMCGHREHDHGASPLQAWQQYRVDAQARSQDGDKLDAANGGASPSLGWSRRSWTTEVRPQPSRPSLEAGNFWIEALRPLAGWIELHYGKARDDRREMAQVRATGGKRKK